MDLEGSGLGGLFPGSEYLGVEPDGGGAVGGVGATVLLTLTLTELVLELLDVSVARAAIVCVPLLSTAVFQL